MTPKLQSYAMGAWRSPADDGVPLHDAVTGNEVARISSAGLDFGGMLDHARKFGGPALRELNFAQRAKLLKDLGKYLTAHVDEFHQLSTRTGATKRDSTFDVDGGIAVLFVYGSKGVRELPESGPVLDGGQEQIGKQGTFSVQHVHTPLRGAAVQVNAFNFPVWGMLEKFAPAFLAGVPTIVKPGSQTAYLTELVFRRIIESGLLPAGALQLVCGSAGDLVNHLTGQDLLSVTGSAATAALLRSHPAVVHNSVRFTAEADSLNCSILGPDAAPGTPEFELYVRQLVTEMTVKAGQKCTAIRRALVPRAMLADVQDAVVAALSEVKVGNPADDRVDMGALAGLTQRDEVLRSLKALTADAHVVYGDPERFDVIDADPRRGAFLPPMLLRSEEGSAVHEVEAFGPVSTLVPYGEPAHAVELAARGAGSLAGSVVTHDAGFAREVALGLAPWHGRVLMLDRDSAGESTGHGSPLPHTVHGGPGRAGGGEELGGIRGVLHHMQRTALQGAPALLRTVSGEVTT